MQETLKTTIAGHVKISDTKTGEVLVDKHNAIHAANMAVAIARGLSNATNYQIYKIKLGNQGTYINNTGTIVYQSTKTTSATMDVTADLYNPTYAEIVDDGAPGVDAGNSVQFTVVPASSMTRVIITAVISSNQAVSSATDTNATTPGQIGALGSTVTPFFFDELGLFTKGAQGGAGVTDSGELMLSHLVFSPIEHTGNRELTISYTLTISVS